MPEFVCGLKGCQNEAEEEGVVCRPCAYAALSQHGWIGRDGSFTGVRPPHGPLCNCGRCRAVELQEDTE